MADTFANFLIPRIIALTKRSFKTATCDLFGFLGFVFVFLRPEAEVDQDRLDVHVLLRVAVPALAHPPRHLGPIQQKIIFGIFAYNIICTYFYVNWIFE
jgi:hypothetical protein